MAKVRTRAFAPTLSDRKKIEKAKGYPRKSEIKAKIIEHILNHVSMIDRLNVYDTDSFQDRTEVNLTENEIILGTTTNKFIFRVRVSLLSNHNMNVYDEDNPYSW